MPHLWEHAIQLVLILFQHLQLTLQLAEVATPAPVTPTIAVLLLQQGCHVLQVVQQRSG